MCVSNNALDVRWKNKFWGKSMEILPIGTVNVMLPRYSHFLTAVFSLLRINAVWPVAWIFVLLSCRFVGMLHAAMVTIMSGIK